MFHQYQDSFYCMQLYLKKLMNYGLLHFEALLYMTLDGERPRSY